MLGGWGAGVITPVFVCLFVFFFGGVRKSLKSMPPALKPNHVNADAYET